MIRVLIFTGFGCRRHAIDIAITHQKVPVQILDKAECLGPNGAVALVTQTLRMIGGRWKLPILFRLYDKTAMRSSQLLRDIPGISHKMLTQHLRELEQDCLIDRRDLGEQPPHVEYRLTAKGNDLIPVLMAARQFSENYQT
ncbi:helix-turn-helix transcriptional regulator [Rhizobium sp. CFBP 8762]|nr:helix-turn-helix domain-containing protein [Rhizobium sp. CFBP 8762]MBD8553855.1 helix-turn-helix transcriptional regulator [Rhizobium sp. CFBP 8762]